jgi:hypothetical protein
MTRRRFPSFLLAGFLVVICSAVAQSSVPANTHCSSDAQDTMTDDEAAKLVKSHEMFGIKATIVLNTGTIHASLSDVERYQPTYAAFKSIGLIELTSIKIESPDKDPKKTTEGTLVTLTEKGLAESRSWKQTRENAWSVDTAARDLVSVLSIQKDAEGRIHGIEFSWRCIPNDIGKALKLTCAPERAYAKLAHDDKGWRIVSIHAL